MDLLQMLAKMRHDGWTVAVHNDYRLNGCRSTFWLFTHEASGRFVKGEGPTDTDAVAAALSVAQLALVDPPVEVSQSQLADELIRVVSPRELAEEVVRLRARVAELVAPDPAAD